MNKEQAEIYLKYSEATAVPLSWTDSWELEEEFYENSQKGLRLIGSFNDLVVNEFGRKTKTFIYRKDEINQRSERG